MAKISLAALRPRGKDRVSIIDYLTLNRWIIPLALIVLYAIVYSILFPKVFPSSYNIASLLLEFSIPALVTIGMALQLINGEIDLSVGYGVMFANVLSCYLIVVGTPIAPAIIVTVITAVIVGFVVGNLVARLGVNSFIATLGAGMVYYGFGLMIYDIGYTYGATHALGGVDMLHLPAALKNISQYAVGGMVQLPVFYALIIGAVFVFLMSKSRYFRKYYYIGMNKEAARLSGINVNAMKTVAFIISAGLSAVAGVLLAARMGSSGTTLGVGMELRVITAAVIGGVSFKGGRGTMIGALLGGLFIFCLSNGLRIAGAPSNMYKVIEGVVLLSAVILDAQFSKRKVIG